MANVGIPVRPFLTGRHHLGRHRLLVVGHNLEYGWQTTDVGESCKFVFHDLENYIVQGSAREGTTICTVCPALTRRSEAKQGLFILVYEGVAPEVCNGVVVRMVRVGTDSSLRATTRTLLAIEADEFVVDEERLTAPSASSREHLLDLEVILHFNRTSTECGVDDTLSAYAAALSS